MRLKPDNLVHDHLVLLVMNKICYKLWLAAVMLWNITAVAQGVITQREGWLDGKVNERMSLSQGSTVLNVAALPEGLHSFTMRVQDSEGRWSSPETRFFILGDNAGELSEIVKVEAWLDGKFSQRQELPHGVATINVASLAPGLHSLTMRVMDNKGLWSANMTNYFMIPYDVFEPTQIAKCVGWIDGKRNLMQTLDPNQARFDISKLSVGLHLFTAQALDTRGRWSSPLSKYFLIPLEAQYADVTINRCQYWFDDNVQNAQFSPLDSIAGIVDLDISPLTAGDHVLSWMVCNSEGTWSEVYTQQFSIAVEEYLLGDINNDGIVDVEDINAIIDVILRLVPASTYGHRCFVNDDDVVDVEDVNIMIDIILRLR